VIKFLFKLAVIALLANATWQIVLVYSDHYKFRDAVEQAAQYGSALSIDQLRQRVMDLATQYDVPLAPESFTLTRNGTHTVVDGSYKRSVQLVPTVSYSWPFTWHVDAIRPPTPSELAQPK
jgi:hypothetical protein